jgi:hypothetical protein
VSRGQRGESPTVVNLSFLDRPYSLSVSFSIGPETKYRTHTKQIDALKGRVYGYVRIFPISLCEFVAVGIYLI